MKWRPVISKGTKCSWCSKDFNPEDIRQVRITREDDNMIWRSYYHRECWYKIKVYIRKNPEERAWW